MKFELFTFAALSLAASPVFAGRLGGLKTVSSKPVRKAPRRLQTSLTLVTQTYFVPLPEHTLMEHTFERINSSASGNINSLVSITVSTDGTVIWYDHVEDGFESDSANPSQASTEIWGDSDWENGCAPGVAPCSQDSHDVLEAGQVVILENSVVLTKFASTYSRAIGQGKKYEAGDRIQASMPIAVTRGAYPDSPGSLMAGGVEVLDTSTWGTNFVAPVGGDTVQGSYNSDAFERTQLYVMASQDGTVVTKGGSTYNINMGGSVQFTVNEADVITSNKPVQVDLLAADVGSTYELRWFSLRPRDQWASSYIAPVGNTAGTVKVRVFNPYTSSMTVRVDEYNRGSTYDMSIPAKTSLYSYVIDDNAGAKFWSTDNRDFMAISVIDAEYDGTSGQIYDWGYPLTPENLLTPEVIIGWGYGCEGNNCRMESFNDGQARSAVYVTPVAKAKIYVDYDNDGTADDTFVVNALQSINIIDPTDKDMSGARIWAKGYSGSSVDQSQDVNIAAAWGQNPDYSGGGDESALDLGTVVVPFYGFSAVKNSEVIDTNSDGLNGPGDTIRYIIQITNVGQGDVASGQVVITDVLDDDVTYTAGTLKYIGSGQQQLVGGSGSTFPLIAGISNPYEFDGRGGQHQVTFDCTINDDITKTTVINTGKITHNNQETPFTNEQPVEYDANIRLKKTVYLGRNGLGGCTNSDLESGPAGTEVTFCFEVTNMGNTYLKSINVDDTELPLDENIGGMLPPGQTTTVYMESTIEANQDSPAEAKGTPCFSNGNSVPGLSDVTDTDPAGVEIETAVVTYNPSIDIEKTVYIGHNGGASCDGDEVQTGEANTAVTFCFRVINTGDTYLKSINVDDEELPFGEDIGGVLAPNGGTATVFYNGSITAAQLSDAVVVGTPSFQNGNVIQGESTVTAKDDAGVLIDSGTSNRVGDPNEEDILCE